MDPLASKALLDKSDIAGIFSNIQEIRAVNSALLQQLEQSPNLSAQHVGEIFTKMVCGQPKMEEGEGERK